MNSRDVCKFMNQLILKCCLDWGNKHNAVYANTKDPIQGRVHIITIMRIDVK